MVLILKHDDVVASVDWTDAIEAMEDGFKEEGTGGTIQPPRINIKLGDGFFRVGPGVMLNAGWMGFKAMNKQPPGVRYQVSLYSLADGDLKAIMDAQHLTTLRTGATSAVATKRLARMSRTVVGVLGSGVEARAQLEAMHALGIVAEARVFSRTPAKREAFAKHYTKQFGVPVKPVATAREAVDGCGVVVAAVSSNETVLYGAWLTPGMHVNSVGTARPTQREIDPATFQRADIIVVDTKEGVLTEAGDALAAKDVIDPDKVYELGALVTGRAPSRSNDDQITLFKSVGSAVQDIALAIRVYQNAKEKGIGLDLAGFPVVKAN